jgi:hypothetical protein
MLNLSIPNEIVNGVIYIQELFSFLTSSLDNFIILGFDIVLFGIIIHLSGKKILETGSKAFPYIVGTLVGTNAGSNLYDKYKGNTGNSSNSGNTNNSSNSGNTNNSNNSGNTGNSNNSGNTGNSSNTGNTGNSSNTNNTSNTKSN